MKERRIGEATSRGARARCGARGAGCGVRLVRGAPGAGCAWCGEPLSAASPASIALRRLPLRLRVSRIRSGAMQTDKAKQFEYNLTVLKRRDAAITEILDMSGHVVLYQFNESRQSWDRKNVEGGRVVVRSATREQRAAGSRQLIAAPRLPRRWHARRRRGTCSS